VIDILRHVLTGKFVILIHFVLECSEGLSETEAGELFGDRVPDDVEPLDGIERVVKLLSSYLTLEGDYTIEEAEVIGLVFRCPFNDGDAVSIRLFRILTQLLFLKKLIESRLGLTTIQIAHTGVSI